MLSSAIPICSRSWEENIIFCSSVLTYAIRHNSENWLENSDGRWFSNLSISISACCVHFWMCLRIRRRINKLYSSVKVSGNTDIAEWKKIRHTIATLIGTCKMFFIQGLLLISTFNLHAFSFSFSNAFKIYLLTDSSLKPSIVITRVAILRNLLQASGRDVYTSVHNGSIVFILVNTEDLHNFVGNLSNPSHMKHILSPLLFKISWNTSLLIWTSNVNNKSSTSLASCISFSRKDSKITAS